MKTAETKEIIVQIVQELIQNKQDILSPGQINQLKTCQQKHEDILENMVDLFLAEVNEAARLNNLKLLAIVEELIKNGWKITVGNKWFLQTILNVSVKDPAKLRFVKELSYMLKDQKLNNSGEFSIFAGTGSQALLAPAAGTGEMPTPPMSMRC